VLGPGRCKPPHERTWGAWPTYVRWNGWMDDGLAARPPARREERERGAGRQVGERETIFFKKKTACHTSCMLPAALLSLFFSSLSTAPLHSTFLLLRTCVPAYYARVCNGRPAARAIILVGGGARSSSQARRPRRAHNPPRAPAPIRWRRRAARRRPAGKRTRSIRRVVFVISSSRFDSEISRPRAGRC
jgi:hypothetical protein